MAGRAILSLRTSLELRHKLDGLREVLAETTPGRLTRSRVADLALALGVAELERLSAVPPGVAGGLSDLLAPEEALPTGALLTDGDAGTWVRASADNRRLAHRLAAVQVEYACGWREPLRLVRRAPDGRRCRRCESLAGREVADPW